MSKATDPPLLPDIATAPDATLGFLPPPYTEHDQNCTEQVPQYESPSNTQPASDSKTLQCATVKFPPALNGYFQWKLTATFHLGPTAEEKLFAVSTHSSVLGNKPHVILHDGPTDKHPILATTRGDKWGRTRPVTVILPPRPASLHKDAIVAQMIPATSKHVSPTFTFEVDLAGKSAGKERFEWRKSHGNEINELAAGHSYGWKLIRLLGPVSNAGGSRKERDFGVASDGMEIVALIAHNASWSMTKGFRFAFMGTGLTGALGEAWEIMTVASALQLWYLDVQAAMAAGSAAAAS